MQLILIYSEDINLFQFEYLILDILETQFSPPRDLSIHLNPSVNFYSEEEYGFGSRNELSFPIFRRESQIEFTARNAIDRAGGSFRICDANCPRSRSRRSLRAGIARTGNDKKHMQHYHCGVYGIKL